MKILTIPSKTKVCYFCRVALNFFPEFVSVRMMFYNFWTEWNLVNAQGSSEVPKVADFLGVGKSENQSEIVPYSEIQANDSDYLFSNSSLAAVPNTLAAVASNNYELQENGSSMQSLTLSMGSGKGSACETSASVDNSNTSIVEATPRRTLDTFGQRTSIYRGVTR